MYKLIIKNFIEVNSMTTLKKVGSFLKSKVLDIWNCMKENELTILYILFGGALITANCIANKMFYVGHWFGEDIYITMGIICYPFTFLITDIIGERWGKRAAYVAVVGGFIGQIVSMALIMIGLGIPGIIFEEGFEAAATAYRYVFGNGPMLILGSICGCLVSQTWDVWIFHKIRDAYIKKHGTTKGGKWIWNNVGTITSQLFDSAIFYGIAFGSTVTVKTYFITILVYWIIKAVIALCDTPFFYLFTRGTDKKIEEKLAAGEPLD